MLSLGKLILIVVSYSVGIGLSISYPQAGIPLMLLLIYATIATFTQDKTT